MPNNNVYPETINDLIVSQLPKHPVNELIDQGMLQQRYPLWDRFYNNAMAQHETIGTHQIRVDFDVRMPDGGTFGSMDRVDEPKVTEHMRTFHVPLTFQTESWAYNIIETSLNGRGMGFIHNVINPRRRYALKNIITDWATAMWAAPSGPEDRSQPFGIDYWNVGNATEGFNGVLPSGWTTFGTDLPSAQLPENKNWTFQFSKISKDDLIAKLDRSFYETHWSSPVKTPGYKDFREVDRAIFTTYRVRRGIERAAEAQNQSLGRDVLSMHDSSSVRGFPVLADNTLDRREGDVIHGLSLDTFKLAFLSGWKLRETPPRTNMSAQHNMAAGFFDNISQLICIDKRQNFRGDFA